MWIKKNCIIVLLLLAAGFVSAQNQNQNRYRNITPMKDSELKAYEKIMGTDAVNPYVPRLQRATVVKLLEELHKTFVQSNVPETLDLYLKNGSNQIPTKSRILYHANKLKTFIADPELQEVSGYHLDWFRNVGNTMVALGEYHAYFIHAVNSRNADAIRFYLSMNGRIVLTEEKQLRMEFSV
jgi:hypothetical protein